MSNEFDDLKTTNLDPVGSRRPDWVENAKIRRSNQTKRLCTGALCPRAISKGGKPRCSRREFAARHSLSHPVPPVARNRQQGSHVISDLLDVPHKEGRGDDQGSRVRRAYRTPCSRSCG